MLEKAGHAMKAFHTQRPDEARLSWESALERFYDAAQVQGRGVG